MTPNYDNATLFVASPLTAEIVEPPTPAVNDAETMRRLCDPFAVRPVETPIARPHHRPA